jgi:hypothetical protein
MSDRVRSRFLVHWTGKDFESNDSTASDRYIQRLLRTIETGLWLNPCREVLVGGRGIYELTVPMTCFTEIRLSAANSHASRYGRLGFGFDRLFILSSGGSPVLYTRPSSDNLVMQRVSGVLGRLDGLESFLTASGGDTDRFYAVRDVWEARDLMQQLCAFIKVMSEPGTDDFQYLEEAEWRVAYNEVWSKDFHSPRFPAFIPQAAKSLGECWERPKNIVPNDNGRPPYFLTFCADDIRVLIAPNDEVRQMICSAPEFVRWASTRRSAMPILTLEECEQF